VIHTEMIPSRTIRVNDAQNAINIMTCMLCDAVPAVARSGAGEEEKLAAGGGRRGGGGVGAGVCVCVCVCVCVWGGGAGVSGQCERRLPPPVSASAGAPERSPPCKRQRRGTRAQWDIEQRNHEVCHLDQAKQR